MPLYDHHEDLRNDAAPYPVLDGGWVRLKMEKAWAEKPVQNAMKPARWLVPGMRGGYHV